MAVKHARIPPCSPPKNLADQARPRAADRPARPMVRARNWLRRFGFPEAPVLRAVTPSPMRAPARAERGLLVRIGEVGGHLGQEVQRIDHPAMRLVAGVDRVGPCSGRWLPAWSRPPGSPGCRTSRASVSGSGDPSTGTKEPSRRNRPPEIRRCTWGCPSRRFPALCLGEPGQPVPAAKERPHPPTQRDTHVAVGHRFKDLLRDELATRRLPFRVTGGTKAALFTRDRKQVLVAEIGAADAGEAMSQHPKIGGGVHQLS
jgi:hypothetical protein